MGWKQQLVDVKDAQSWENVHYVPVLLVASVRAVPAMSWHLIGDFVCLSSSPCQQDFWRMTMWCSSQTHNYFTLYKNINLLPTLLRFPSKWLMKMQMLGEKWLKLTFTCVLDTAERNVKMLIWQAACWACMDKRFMIVVNGYSLGNNNKHKCTGPWNEYDEKKRGSQAAEQSCGVG